MMKTYPVSRQFTSFAKANSIPDPLSRHLLKALNLTRLSTISLIASLLLSIPLHNSVIATLPLALQVLVMSDSQRRQVEKQQHSAEKDKLAISRVESELNELKHTLTTLKDSSKIPTHGSSQLSSMPTHFNQVLVKLRQIQDQQKVFELERLASLEQKVQQQQHRVEQFIKSMVLYSSNNQATVGLAASRTAKEPIRPKTDRVTIFIDEANLYCSALERGIVIDYAKFFTLLKNVSPNCHAIAYVATDRTNVRQHGFLRMLKRQGFEIVTQEMIKRLDGSVKGNIDLLPSHSRNRRWN